MDGLNVPPFPEKMDVQLLNKTSPLRFTTGMSLRSAFLTMVARSWRCEDRKALYVAVSPMD